MLNPSTIDVQGNDAGDYIGVTAVEALVQIGHGASSGSIFNAFSGAAALSIDMLSAATDPIGYVSGQLISWMIEHCEPIREAFNSVAGDPGVIKESAAAWSAIQQELTQLVADLSTTVEAGTTNWTGATATAYGTRSTDLVQHLTAAAQTADITAQLTMSAGEFVAGIRTAIRDVLAALAGGLVTDALIIMGTLTTGTPAVVSRALARIASSTSKVVQILNTLIQAIKALGPAASSVRDLIDGTFKSLAVFVNSNPALAGVAADIGKDVLLPPGIGAMVR
ncbi:hypothetical protein IU433_06525 [Nocardia puris]|uniref:PPE domain-containing protein n=1 Tax=Nocardia puris TaxID=208602 RepID=A0A366DCM9_9NOCA|nr:hypothetical protein [Nocardia puris]MBF6211189.1 hypothetical protein [Nocardia puris]MBF6364908.1 hypothetical protein [Nocardia puris]MBF6458694.1 hypothetical protein [Nocardia puris]RBO87807.1 hypothetical protein DFR74_11061 [Nocardia puris]